LRPTRRSATTQGLGTINNDDQPSLTVGDVTANEGNSGSTVYSFNINLSQPAPAGGVTFDITTADGSATAGSDYTARSLPGAAIPRGNSSVAVQITVSGDAVFESDETFLVNVTNVTGASVADGQGLGTISNDDAPPVLTSITPSSGSTAGGTVVPLTGTGLSGTTAVSFGGVAATAVNNIDATTVEAVTGARTAGANLPVVLTIAAITNGSSTLPAAYTYFNPAPTITNVSPLTGSAGINTPTPSVTITGTNFTGTTAVTFGGIAAASFTIDSPIQITARPAALVAGDLGSDGRSTRSVAVATPNGSATATQSVILDGAGPSATSFPANQTVNTDAGQATAVVTYAAPVWNDVSGLGTQVVTGLASGSPFPVGVNTVQFTISDAFGNPTTPRSDDYGQRCRGPSDLCVPANITRGTDAGAATAVVTFTPPTASDNVAVTGFTQTAGLASGSAFPVGITTNRWRAVDAAGNETTASFTVTVGDTEAPVISGVPANITRGTDAGAATAVVTFTPPTASDNVAVTGFHPDCRSGFGFRHSGGHHHEPLARS
jgi:hypothetical protein